jgi:chromosome segregation ATPase
MQEETRAILVQKISDLDGMITKATTNLDDAKTRLDASTAIYETASKKLSDLQDLRFKLQADLNENSEGLTAVSSEVQNKVSDITKG